MTLSTPILWVVLPLIIAGITAIFYQKRLLSILLPGILSFGLAILALFFPEDLTLSLGPFTLNFSEGLSILGRQIILALEILPFIAFIFFITGLWILLSGISGTPQIFRPISLSITALLSAALGIEPFLYAAMLIEAVVLISIPMLSPSWGSPRIGVLRYLTLQTIAVPFILLAGWLLSGVESLPPESVMIGQSAILLGIGFALLLGIFPFHSWIPMVSENSHPSVVGFLLFITPTTILIFGLNFFNRYPFLRNMPDLNATLRLFGTVMILWGGLLTALQDDLKRAFGFATITETGFSLLSLSLIPQGGLTWMLMLLPGRALGFYLWSYALSQAEIQTKPLKLGPMKGFAHRNPLIALSLVAAQLSIAGLPLLAAFPAKITLLTEINGLENGIAAWSFIGNLGLFISAFRLLAVLVAPAQKPNEGQQPVNHKVQETLPAIIIILVLILLGLIPNTLLIGLSNILTAFPQLQ